MAMEGGFPDEFVPILRMQHAPLPENGKSLVLDIIQIMLAFSVAARQMRRLFGPCGNEARQDVLLAADVDTASEDESGDAVWGAYREA